MGEFQRMNGTRLPVPLVGVVGTKMHLKYVPARGESLSTDVQLLPTSIAREVGIDRRTAQNFLTFTLEFLQPGNASLCIGPKSASSKGVATPIMILKMLAWPVAGSTTRALTELFVAETMVPGSPGYSDANAEKSMGWMSVVIRNRLIKASALVGSAGAKSSVDVIRAHGQFEGFSAYPALSAAVQERLRTYLVIANDAGDVRSAALRRFFDIAFKVAASNAVADPYPTGLYFWRTQGSGAPSDRTLAFQSLMGNTFYTLK